MDARGVFHFCLRQRVGDSSRRVRRFCIGNYGKIQHSCQECRATIKNGMATASAILAVRKGADEVKTSVGGEEVPLDTFSQMVKNCGNHYGFDFRIKTTELHRIVRQIEWIAENAKREKSPLSLSKSSDSDFHFDIHDGKDAVISAVSELGYSLSDEDNDAVYEEFLRVAAKKDVGTKELEAIVASVALQVPATYQLCNYIVNTGNVLASSAQITLTKNGETIQGISMGDGPIDAAFLALEQLIGRHFELDDFQIQAVTEGKEAMGSAFIKLRSDGKLLFRERDLDRYYRREHTRVYQRRK